MSYQKSVVRSYIKETVKELLKNATQTIKSLSTFQPTKPIPNFSWKIGPLKK